MTPAAILTVLVRSQGARSAAAELAALDAAGKRAATGGLAAAETAAARSSRGLAAAGTRLSAAGKATREVGASLSRLSAPIIGLGIAAGKMADDFESSMSKIEGLVGVSSGQVRAWSKDVLALAKTLPQSPKELADALFFVTSAGFRGKEAMHVLKTSARAAAAGLGETKTVADAVTSALNAYHGAGLSATDVTDTLVAAVRAGKMPTEALAGAIGQVLPVASETGVTFKEVAGTAAALSRSGANVNRTMTGVRFLLSGLVNPTSKAAKVLSRVGISAADLRKEVKEKGLLATLQDLKKRLPIQDFLKVVGGARGVTTALGLVGRNGKQVAQVMEDVRASSGSTNKAFEVASKTSKFKLSTALSGIKVALIQIGAAILPVVVPLFQGLAAAVGAAAAAFSGLSPGVKTAIVVAALFLAALGPATFVVGGLVGALGALLSALGALLGLLTLPVVAIAALAAAFYLAYKHIEPFRQAVDAVAGAIASAGRAVVNEVGQWDLAFSAIASIVRALVGIVKAQFEALKTVISVAMVALGPVFAAGWAVIKGVFSAAWTLISGIVRGGFDVVRGIVKVIGGLLKGDFRQVWDGVKTIFSGAWTAIRGILQGAWKIIKTPIDAIKAGITDAFDKTFDRVGSIFSGAVKTITGFVNAIIDVINILPFVEIKHVGSGSKDYTKNAAGGKGKFGPNFAEGGKVTAPVAIMGEEAPRHPEWVIPTNPAYRGRAVGLWAAAAHDLGIPGFLLGGLHVPSPAKAFDFVSSLPGRVASAAGVGAKWLVDKLPGNPFGSGIFKGVGRYVLKEGGEWIRDAAGKVWGAATSFLGEGGGKTRGLVPQVLRALAFARRRGWAGAVSSGVRSRAEQAFLWNNAPALGLVRGVSVAKPGTSEHERGRAVDVTQWEAFRKIMAGAPASSRLLWRGPTDRVHFSVSGHRRGGLLRLAAGGRWSASDIAELGWKVGLRGNKDVLATAIALAESGGDPNARYRNKDGTIDRGLWQINSVHGALSTFGPLANARAMKKISKGGTNWRPWTKFRNRDYVDYLPRARRAVAALAKKQAASKKTTAATKVAAGVSGQENLFSAALTAAQVRTPVRKGQTPEEYTAAISDDLNVLKLWLKWAQGELDKAMTTGNAEAIQRFAPMVDTVGTQITDLASATPAVGHTYGEEPSAEDPALAALEANTAAIEEQNRLAASLDEAIRAQLAFARSVEGIAGYQAIKALSDIISGHIMGKGYAPRSRTASSGKVVSY